MRQVDPVAITGMGLVTAAGAGLADTLSALSQKQVPRVAPPPFATAHTFPVFRCVERGQEPPVFFTTPSRTARLAFWAAQEALSAGKVPGGKEPAGTRLGVVVGTSVGASLNFFDFYRATVAGENPSLAEIHEYLTANPALALGDACACSGPAVCVTNACSSGADAIGTGAAWIRSGRCDMVLAGGADALSYVTYAGFCSLRLPSPTGCRPFEADRDGLTLGEGAGFMLLESEQSRKRRGVKAQGFVAGYGTATDAYHLTAPHPEGRGLAVAAGQAFAQAGASWADIAFINAHGTGTAANDAAEGAFFARHCPATPFIATKGATGHTLGAAGAVEAVLTAAHLSAGELPPTPDFRQPDPTMSVAPVAKATPVQGRLALSQSLAFGGNNTVLLIAGGEV